MKKSELRKYLLAGYTLGQCFDFVSGQECVIVKAESFTPGKNIIYIPDLYVNDLYEYCDHAVLTDSAEETDEIIKDILDICYCGDDFLELCNGNTEQAERLFNAVDWQHPTTVLDEGWLEDDDEEGYFIVSSRWYTEDVLGIAKELGADWTAEEAREWFEKKRRAFLDQMAETGNAILRDMIYPDLIASGRVHGGEEWDS